MTHLNQVLNNSFYEFSFEEDTPVAYVIAAARIWCNLGYKAAKGYAAKRGLDMRLVRLACTLEACKELFMKDNELNVNYLNCEGV